MDSEQETQATAVSEGEQQPSNISENSAESAPDYNDLTVSKLKELLKELDLPLSGKKSDLIERLQASNEKVTEQSVDSEDKNESDDSEDKTKEPLVSFDKLDGLSRTELKELRKEYNKQADIRIDTYRASGAGGQHVNKTDSAVRITHFPSNIVVQCQNDRSQHKNKSNAMAMLKSRLYELEIQKRKEEENKINSEKKDIGWGNQIRSYILHPYKLIKDLRTNHESSNVNDVLPNVEPCLVVTEP